MNQQEQLFWKEFEDKLCIAVDKLLSISTLLEAEIKKNLAELAYEL
jgi:hypothetical protein